MATIPSVLLYVLKYIFGDVTVLREKISLGGGESVAYDLPSDPLADLGSRGESRCCTCPAVISSGQVVLLSEVFDTMDVSVTL